MQTKIALVGDFWNEHEEAARMPFVGPAGYQLNTLLEEAGIERASCFLTNVFNLRPRPNNDIKNLCGPKRDDQLGLPPLATGAYLKAEYKPELLRLYSELVEVRPNLVVCLGGVALWALTGVFAISKLRGTLIESRAFSGVEPPIGLKLLPTYHPSYVIKVATSRPIMVMDLLKAKRQSEFPEIRRPSRTVILEPSLDDLQQFLIQAQSHPVMAVDIETAQERITCVGFAISPSYGIVIPFWDVRRGGNYWGSLQDECAAWGVVRELLGLECKKLFQNGLYDVHWLWRKYGIPVKNFHEDTMLLHHSLQPEFEKGLGFLGSVYTDEPAWKLNKPKGNKKAVKKED